jgi:glycosyltransferase involved in cell wall biosynthesis
MKIGIVAPAAAPANGIGIYAQQMADALSTNAVVESFWVGEEASGNHISIRKNHLADYESAAATMNSSCDVCLLHHGFSAYGWRDGGLVTVLAQRLRIPLVVVFHEVEHLAGENRRALGHALAEKAQQVIVMSKQAANVVEHLFKIPASIIKILHYGVPDFDVKSREDAKKIIGIGNRPIILCAGLMKPSDQLPIILDAVSSIVTKIPDLLFMHLGQSSYEEAKLSGSSYRHQLLLMARQYGLVNNVCFIDRFLPNDEWCTYLQCADLCIVAEADESTSQCAKLPMAMAAGLAIMSSPFLYANEILGDKLGEISAFDDARVLSTKMLNLLGNPKQLALYRQAAGDFGAQFSWSVMAPKYLGLLKSVLFQHNGPLLFASMNDAQLLVPIQSVARCGVSANADVETLSWRMIGSATQLQCGGRTLTT